MCSLRGSIGCPVLNMRRKTGATNFPYLFFRLGLHLFELLKLPKQILLALAPIRIVSVIWSIVLCPRT